MKPKSRLILILILICAVLLCYFLPDIIGKDGEKTQVITSVETPSAKPVAEPENISAKRCVLLEADSLRVIWEKNSADKSPIASTTKILTALLTLTQPGLDDTFTVDSNAIKVEGSSMGLVEGDTVSLRALAVGMLTVSGNDAANAAAVKISGSLTEFAKLMNNTASSIGMKNSRFVTPSGLDANGHYSTAFDMAVLAAHALRNPDFAAVCGSGSTTTSYGNPPYLRNLINGNRMLRLYDGAIGVKTGYTSAAGRCLVSAAERGGVRLICVTLDAPDDWNDHTKLLDYGFSKVVRATACTDNMSFSVAVLGSEQKLTVIPSGLVQVSCLADEQELITAEIRLPVYAVMPISAGQKLGTVEYFYNGRIVATADLIAASDMKNTKEEK